METVVDIAGCQQKGFARTGGLTNEPWWTLRENSRTIPPVSFCKTLCQTNSFANSKNFPSNSANLKSTLIFAILQKSKLSGQLAVSEPDISPVQHIIRLVSEHAIHAPLHHKPLDPFLR